MNRQFTLYINENMFNSHDKRNTNLNYAEIPFFSWKIGKNLKHENTFYCCS